MSIPNDIRRIHLVGVAGTAMAALAAMLQEKGFEVTGSDERVYPPMSEFLASRKISFREGYSERNLPEGIDLAVIGNAVSRGNEEVEIILDRGIPYRSLPEVLREWFIRGKRSIVVTGTHGKTTTTSLLAWILHEAGRDPSFFIGGIPRNFHAGFRLGQGPDMVVEGDEYDTAFFDKRPKFLHYLPNIATLGSLEYDHADIYASLDEILRGFRRFLNILPRNGRLIINASDPRAEMLAREAPCAVVRCGLDAPEADWSADKVRAEDGRVQFMVSRGGRRLGWVRWALPGRHNVLNALLAVAAADSADVASEEALGAIATFKGVRRRLELIGDFDGILVYDDFAHHPTAIRSALEALRELHPNRRLWAILEPRSNSMCKRVFQDVLPDALAGADVVLIGAVHRAERIPPEERLEPERVIRALRSVKRAAWYIPDVPGMVDHIRRRVRSRDVLCIMSNGGFGSIQARLMEALMGPMERHPGGP